MASSVLSYYKRRLPNRHTTLLSQYTFPQYFLSISSTFHLYFVNISSVFPLYCHTTLSLRYLHYNLFPWYYTSLDIVFDLIFVLLNIRQWKLYISICVYWANLNQAIVCRLARETKFILPRFVIVFVIVFVFVFVFCIWILFLYQTIVGWRERQNWMRLQECGFPHLFYLSTHTCTQCSALYLPLFSTHFYGTIIHTFSFFLHETKFRFDIPEA